MVDRYEIVGSAIHSRNGVIIASVTNVGKHLAEELVRHANMGARSIPEPQETVQQAAERGYRPLIEGEPKREVG